MVRVQQLKNMTSLVVCLGAMFALPAVSLGDFLVTYDFDPEITGDDAGAVAASFDKTDSVDWTGFGSDTYLNEGYLGTTLAESIDKGSYISLHVAASGTDTISFSSLSLDIQSTSDDLYVFAGFQTSLTGFTSSDPIYVLEPTAGISGRTYVEVTRDLTEPVFKNITSTDDIEIRIYAAKAESVAGTYVKIDDTIALAGTVVPEPATLALASVGGLLMAVKRRRRRA